jgi:ketosteroid isomerase-like protein
MTRVLTLVIVVLALALGAHAQTAADGGELTKMLNEFLAGAARNDAAVHDRFWAEDLIYTGSSGRRIGKADIMRDLRPAPAPKSGDPLARYSAEDVRIQQYGDAAVVAFRLVSTTERDGKTQVAKYLNTGTFLKRQGKWQVVSWQATRVPGVEEQEKKAVLAAEAALHQALLASDLNTLAALTDESFIWTRGAGEQMRRQQLLDDLGSGRLKYVRLETNNVSVSMHGEAAIVRGGSLRQRNPTPGSPRSGDATPFTDFYTLTFVNKGGTWKAVAMHSSRP